MADSTDVVHNRVAMLRAERRISRRDLAEALGVHYQTAYRWVRSGDTVLLSSVGRGQEFVLTACSVQDSAAWLRTLFADAT